MLTLEQLTELQRKIDCGCADCAPREALWEHREALLESAARVLRRAPAPFPIVGPEHFR